MFVAEVSIIMEYIGDINKELQGIRKYFSRPGARKLNIDGNEIYVRVNIETDNESDFDDLYENEDKFFNQCIFHSFPSTNFKLIDIDYDVIYNDDEDVGDFANHPLCFYSHDGGSEITQTTAESDNSTEKENEGEEEEEEENDEDEEEENISDDDQ